MSGFSLHEVSVRYGDFTALDRVSLSVAAGERVGLVGPSGAGKTTLLRLMAAAAVPDEGTLSVLGHEALDGVVLREVRSRIGVVHQDLRLVPELRVAQNVLAGRAGRWGFFRSMRAVYAPGRAALAEVHEVLARVGIPEKLFERTDRLSGGQQQRVAIARALYQEPAALLADEPVSSVDPARSRAVLTLLTELAEASGLTLVVSLHDLALARAFFPRLVGVRAGRVVFDRPSEELSDSDFEALFALEGA